MDRNLLIILIVVVIIGLGLIFYFNRDTTGIDGFDGNGTSTTNSTTTLGSGNTLTLGEQESGTSVSIERVVLERPGFIVIHESQNGQLGRVLGRSDLLDEGTTRNVRVIVPLEEGKSYIAMLHTDNGDESFSEANDPAAKDSAGNAVQIRFQVATSTTQVN